MDIEQAAEISEYSDHYPKCLMIINEYAQRKNLATLGYRFSKISPFKVDCFMIIDQAINEIKDKKAK